MSHTVEPIEETGDSDRQYDRKFRQLKWLVVASPLLVVLVLEYSRWALGTMMSHWQGRLIMDGVVLVGAVFFYAVVSHVIDGLMKRLERQNWELRALRHASLDITSDLSLEGLLQRIVDQARTLLGCRYGALAVYGADGELESFVTSGIDGATKDRIGAPPVGKGLLALPLRHGQNLRLQDLQSHPRSVGFPPEHPAMRSLVAVPVICREPFRGNLYLSEKIDQSELSKEDEETLARFATQVAIAVDNAQLHAKVAGMAVMDERLRLAREMHDGQAQVLAYVNTKAQVVGQLLDSGSVEEARRHLDQMASAAREVYADVREGILGLRTAVDHDHDLAVVLKEFGYKWQDQSGIRLHLDIVGQTRYDREVELHLLRVVQESLTNVRKHSKAQDAFLKARIEPELLELEVRDEGTGFRLSQVDGSPAGLARFGVSTMRERCHAVGAELKIESEPGEGTCIRVTYRPGTRAPSPIPKSKVSGKEAYGAGEERP